jgi:hypothetical protein
LQTTLVLPWEGVLILLKMPESFIATLDDKEFRPDVHQAIDLCIDLAWQG